MKRTIVITLMLAMLSMGCASATIDTWANRGIQGVEYGKVNIDTFSEKIQEALRQQKEADIDAFFDDILQVAQGKINGVQIDEQWLKEHRAALKLFMTAWAADEQALRNAVAKAHDNLDSVTEAFEQIKRLRRAWSQGDAIEAQLDRLTTIVMRVLNERKGS